MKKAVLGEHPFLLILTAMLGITKSMICLGQAYIVQYLVETTTSNNISELLIGIGASGIFIIIYLCVYLLAGRMEFKLSAEISLSMKQKVFLKILSLKYRTFKSRDNGEYIALVTEDTDIVVAQYYLGIMAVIYDVALYISAVIMMFKMNLWVAILVVCLIAGYALYRNHVSGKISTLVSAYLAARNIKIQNVTEIVGGYSEIREYCAGQRFIQKEYCLEKKQGELFREVQVLSQVNMLLMVNIAEVINLAILCLSAYMTIYRGVQLSVAEILALSEMMAAVLEPIASTSALLLAISEAKGPKNELEELLNSDEEKGELKISSPVECTDIILNNIDFSYDDTRVLSNFSARFLAGGKYAIVGESGSGKTTIMRLLMKLEEPDRGEIVAGDIPYDELMPEDINRLVAYVPQEPFLFDDTIEQNIRLDQVGNYDWSLRTASVDRVIMDLPEGDKTIIRGNDNLSGGQKMRVTIARALHSEKKILLLDEFSAGLDEKAADEIEDRLLTLEGYTVIVITHRLSDKFRSRYTDVIELK